MTDLAKFFPEQCGNNQEWKEINFKVFPEYPFIDCGADPNYWFGSQYKEVGDLHCPDAAELGKGIFPKGPMSIKGQEVIQGKKIPGTLPIEKTDPE